MSKKVTFEEFVRRAREKHGDKYEYLKSSYNGISSKVKIICPTHGTFEQSADGHVRGRCCSACADISRIRSRTSDLESFIAKAVLKHGDRFDYSKVVYVKSNQKVDIICKEHGCYKQTPNNHLQSNGGCPLCKYETISNKRLKNTEWFLQKAIEKHGFKYDYSTTDYISSAHKLSIRCKTHGVFYQLPHVHLKGCGCPTCANDTISEKQICSVYDFVKKSKIVHGDKYDYSQSVYKGKEIKVEIVCPKHGSFWQTPANHYLRKSGCPKCGHQVSKAEQEIFDFLKIYVNVKQSDRQSIKPLELDMYLKDLNIGVEYHGLFYHSDKFRDKNYHLEKLNLCNSKGIKLIQIFEDEWFDKKEICKSRLLNLIGETSNKIFARKCVIKEVSASESRAFLETNHIQGNVGAKIKLGLYYEDELVSIMTFGNLRKNLGQTSKEGSYELLRFCNKLNTNVVGGASKLLKYFEKTYQPKEIISYADRRWSEGKLYQNLGFNHTSNSQPNYFYVKSTKRENRFNYRKSELIKQGFDPNKTEKQIMEEQGFVRIYDCGSMKFTKNY